MHALLLASLLLTYTGADGCHIPGYTTAFDQRVRSAVRMYLPPAYHDWCWVKSQAIAESDLRPDAVSPVGARCLLQIMPGTQRDIETRYGIAGNIFSAHHCVRVSVLYTAQLINYFSYRRTVECRRLVVISAYNAGPGNIDKAQVHAGGARCWPEIAPHLHRVTGRHARETIGYVDRIQSLRARMR